MNREREKTSPLIEAVAQLLKDGWASVEAEGLRVYPKRREFITLQKLREEAKFRHLLIDESKSPESPEENELPLV